MNARTKTLFHFTGKKDGINDLLRILEEGFWPQYSLEDISWLNAEIKRLAWPMVSFCDIPISRLGEHTEHYGCYGIGLCRRRWKAYGLNPLLYVSPDSMLKRELGELLQEMRKNPSPRIRTCAMVVLAHCKPLDGITELKGTKRTKDFYSECEWRYIPWVEGVGGENKFGFFLSKEQFDDKNYLREANQERQKRMLEVDPDDVRYLMVKTREDVRTLIHFIDKLDRHSGLEKDLLKTRIMLLDDIACDV